MTLSEEGEGGEETPPTVEDGEPEPLELPETDSTQTSETGRFRSFVAMVTGCHGYQQRGTTFICSHLLLRNTCDLRFNLVLSPSHCSVFQYAKTEGEGLVHFIT